MIITFIPDRLNQTPVIWRGFTVSELLLSALLGAIFGFLLALFLVPVAGFVVVPVMSVLMPLPVVWFAGGILARLKRGKPDNWLWQFIGISQARIIARITASDSDNAVLAVLLRYGTYKFIQSRQQRWEIRRSHKGHQHRGIKK